MANLPDVLVVGGGIIGLTSAFQLTKAGLAVEVIDRGDLGREASWAGAGILPPGNPERAATPIDRLRAVGSVRFPEFSAELRDLTGLDNGYLRCGGVEFVSAEDAYAVDLWRAEGIRFEAGEPVAGVVPPTGTTPFHLPDCAQVRNPWHLRALVAACERVGVRLRPHTPFAHQLAGRTLIAAGAWADDLLGDRVGVHPVRGQIVLFRPELPLFTNVLMAGKRYLVPRADGRVLAGSTEEPEAGFEKANTDAGVRSLIDFACELVPALGSAAVEKTWAGLRPGSPDGLPFIGSVPGRPNVFAAVGHFRAGVQLSLGTAELVCDLLLGKPIPDAFRLDRTPDPSARPAFRS